MRPSSMVMGRLSALANRRYLHEMDFPQASLPLTADLADPGQGAECEPGCDGGQAGPGEAARERSGQWRQCQSRRTIRLGRLRRSCGARQHKHVDRGWAGRAGTGDERHGRDQNRAAAGDILSAFTDSAVSAGELAGTVIVFI